MSAIINFKICDNSNECDALAICPTKAINWNQSKKTLEIDESKCISCGSCVKACMADAIKVATGKDLQFIKNEYEKDKRKTSDLFIDRYGAQSTDETSLISYSYFQSLIIKKDSMVFEVFDSASTMCLIKSIPIRELFKKGTLFNKIDTDEEKTLIDQYKIKELPCLLFFKNGKLEGKIEGFFDTTKKEELLDKIKKIGF
ncbi:MAG: 4Fe-4S binding protein [Candidatus Shapirobacteria bacterium]